jgi:hypothetical protein
MGAAAAAATIKPPPPWTCERSGDPQRNECDAPAEFDDEEVARRVAAAAAGEAPLSMYFDGAVRGDGEGGPGDDEDEVGLYKLNSADHSLKAPGFNP